MSRIGKKPVQIPESVTVVSSDQALIVRGAKGELSVPVPTFIKADIVEGKVVVSLKNSADRATWGRVRSEINNAVRGVTDGWTKTLEIIGTGYRGTTDGRKLTLSLGFSHPVEIVAPEIRISQRGFALGAEAAGIRFHRRAPG